MDFHCRYWKIEKLINKSLKNINILYWVMVGTNIGTYLPPKENPRPNPRHQQKSLSREETNCLITRLWWFSIIFMKQIKKVSCLGANLKKKHFRWFYIIGIKNNTNKSWQGGSKVEKCILGVVYYFYWKTKTARGITIMKTFYDFILLSLKKGIL